MAISNPLLWGYERVRSAGAQVGHSPAGEYARNPAAIHIARIDLDDLRVSLRRGVADFAANRTDVLFLCLFFPVIGLLASRAAFTGGLVPLLFPLASGFALIGPLAGVGLYEISRRRERGQKTAWSDALRVVRSPSLGAIATLGFMLIGLLVLWLLVAWRLWQWTLGPPVPASAMQFLAEVFGTQAGWALILLGCCIGFWFAVLAFAIGVVSFPLLLEHDVGVDMAVRASLAAVRQNMGPMAAWAFIVALGLVLGSIPFLLGLPIVLPIIGHATWHLYRRVVVSEPV
jgi:uncharacterized membrane protein